MSQICISTNYVMLYTLATLLIMAWALYQAYQPCSCPVPEEKETFTYPLAGPDQIPNRQIHNSPPIPPDPFESPPFDPFVSRQNYLLGPHSGLYLDSTDPPLTYQPPSLGYQLVGYVHNGQGKRYQLYTRPHPRNRYKYEYYVYHPKSEIKIPLYLENRNEELTDGDQVQVEGDPDTFTVVVYDYKRGLF